MSFLKQLLGNLLGGHHGNNRHRSNHHGGGYVNAPTQACPQCRTSQPSNARFCDNCGTALSGAICACGNALAPNAKFCSQCGKSP